MHALRALPLIIVIFALAACGGQATNTGGGGSDGGSSPAASAGGGGGAGGGEGDGACRLVTEAEVEAALGVTVADTIATGDTNCSFTDDEGGPLFAFSVIESSEAIDVHTTFESQLEVGEQVDGIGDGAIWFGSGAMYVIKGDTLVNMVATTGGEDEDAEFRAAVEGLARVMADRM